MLLAICAGNSPVTGEFPAKRPVTRSFDVFFDLCLNKRLSKQPWAWWSETPWRPLWRHCNGNDFEGAGKPRSSAIISGCDKIRASTVTLHVASGEMDIKAKPKMSGTWTDSVIYWNITTPIFSLFSHLKPLFVEPINLYFHIPLKQSRLFLSNCVSIFMH